MKLFVIALCFAVFVTDNLINGEAYWTKWLNRDKPRGLGDFETYKGFQPAPCDPTFHPIDAECRVKTENGTRIPWYESNNKIVRTRLCNHKGIACRNRVQSNPNATCCADFEIKFLCYKHDPTPITCTMTTKTKAVVKNVNQTNNV